MGKDNELWLLARTKIQEEAYEEAIQLLDQALKADPKNATLISEKGVACFHLGRKHEALNLMNLAAEIEPDNPYRYSSRAYIKSNMDMLDSAIDDYEICVEMDPNDPIAYNNLGLLLEIKGRISEAKLQFKKSDKLNGIETAQSKEDPNTNVETIQPEEITNNEDAEEKETRLKIIKDTFTKKSVFREYINFIKSGFKLEKKDE